VHNLKLQLLRHAVTLCLFFICLAWFSELQAATGIIEVDSVPQGADVFIDGVPVGKTPYIDAEIETGRHAVRIHYSDAFPDKYWRVIVDEITPVRKTFYFTSLEKGMVVEAEDQGTVQEFQGNVQIASIPSGATVFVNGEEVGKAPLGLKNLPVGLYSLRMEAEGWSRETDFPVKRDKTTKVIADIGRNTIRVSAPGQRDLPYIHMDISFYLSRISRETISSLVVDVDRDTGQARGTIWSPLLYGDQENHQVRGRVDRRGRMVHLNLYDGNGQIRGSARLGGPLGRVVALDSFRSTGAYDRQYRLNGLITFAGRMYRIISRGRNMPPLPQYLVRTETTPYDYHDFLLPPDQEPEQFP